MADHPKDIRACKGPNCGADIFFAVSEKGRPIPLDPKPVRQMQLTWEPDPSNVTQGGLWRARSVEVYVPHHATCPDAKRFRGTKGNGR